MKKRMLVGILCLLFLSCEENQTPVPNLQPDLKNLQEDLDFEKLIQTDFLLFQALNDREVSQSSMNNAVNGRAVHASEIKSLSEFSDYFSQKGYRSKDIPHLMIESARLTGVISQKYGILDNLTSGNESSEFSKIYSEEFRLRVKSHFAPVKLQGNEIRVEDTSNPCATSLVSTWNENASDHRKNAAACATLPGPLGTACVYLAGVALERQQEEAYNDYRTCMGWSVVETN